MSKYRINVRFDLDKPMEAKAAQYLQSLDKSRNAFTLIINASKKSLSIDNIPLDDIETAFEGETGALEGCSSLSTPAPPQGY